MKIFLDTADTELIKKYYGTGLIDGVTTNPTLIRKSGRDPEDVYQELADYGVRDISMEVVGDEKTMTEEGRRLHSKYAFQSKKLSINPTTIKVPLSPDGLRTCRSLALDGIKVNVTLVFSAAQAILASKAGAAYVSPFVGRLDDQSVNGIGLINQIASIYIVCTDLKHRSFLHQYEVFSMCQTLFSTEQIYAQCHLVFLRRCTIIYSQIKVLNYLIETGHLYNQNDRKRD